MNWYNEINKEAAAWLRELISAGHIAPGIVDERSIVDVRPEELIGFKQCHFFAGIGVWSYSLRLAGVSDDEDLWTGSCPCQPFSSAGKGYGFDDERHLWPYWQWLIEQCKPAKIIGEQVAAKAVEPWIDLVQADLEALGYSFGCVPFASASVGAPHIRDRAYWVADSKSSGLEGKLLRTGARLPQDGIAQDREPIGMADASGVRCGSGSSSSAIQEGRESRPDAGRQLAAGLEGRSVPGVIGATLRDAGSEFLPGPINGFWRNADWIFCRDGKWRPVKPGLKPLVNGAARGMVPGSNQGSSIDADETGEARVMRLKGYGNAINAQAAKEFIIAAIG